MGKSSSSEDYLKCILVLQKKNDSVRYPTCRPREDAKKLLVKAKPIYKDILSWKGEKRWI